MNMCSFSWWKRPPQDAVLQQGESTRRRALQPSAGSAKDLRKDNGKSPEQGKRSRTSLILKQFDNFQYKEKKKEVKEAKREKKDAKSGTAAHEKAKKKYQRLKEQLEKIETQMKDKVRGDEGRRTDWQRGLQDENKQIALGTSKLNYLDPRISIAWCKKFNVPVEKVGSFFQF